MATPDTPDTLVSLFEAIGLTPQRAKDTAKNKKLATALQQCIQYAQLPTHQNNDEKTRTSGALLYTLASTGSTVKDAAPHLEYIAKAIGDGRIGSGEQVAAAIKFVQDYPAGSIDDAKFNQACGVGITVSPAEIKSLISQQISQHKTQLIAERYVYVNKMLGGLRQIPELRWANGQAVKEEFDTAILELLGPKDERDVVKKKKEKAPKVVEASKSPTTIAPPTRHPFAHLQEGEMAKLHRPGGNKQIKESLMVEHLKATGGKVRTRFPPEPNGFLHIGHAKAINVSFGYALIHDGKCNLRFDDTNPEAEDQMYFDSIEETVEWLGFTPDRVTYSSDHFQRLYDLAVQMIKIDKAYVCHCTGEEIHAQRGGDNKGPRFACPHRDRPIEESIEIFENMRIGEYKEGEATLRMKMDLTNGNPQFWDLVAYRIMHVRHHRTGAQWCIYPTYDYTHCLCDSFENITHSLCTTEFQLARESYYWLCDALEVYKPVQWEFGRLNVTRTVLSKRKILQLVENKVVAGWDDPRLYTLPALRRRGVPPEAINNFVREVGVTTASSVIDVARLDNQVRDVLNEKAPRIMAVIDPVLLVIENLPTDHLEMLEIPNKPRDPAMGTHRIPFTSRVYIDASDFRTTSDDPNYYRLAPGKTVGLLFVPHPVTLTSIVQDPETGKTRLICRYENGPNPPKPKTFIQWVADSPAHHSPVHIDQLQLYNPLFIHSNPQDKAAVPGGYLSDINPDSLTTVTTAIAEIGLSKWIREHPEDHSNPEKLHFQFVRIGYFCVDKETDWEVAKGKSKAFVAEKLVMNKTVDLKEDVKKDVTK